MEFYFGGVCFKSDLFSEFHPMTYTARETRQFNITTIQIVEKIVLLLFLKTLLCTTSNKSKKNWYTRNSIHELNVCDLI